MVCMFDPDKVGPLNLPEWMPLGEAERKLLEGMKHGELEGIGRGDRQENTQLSQGSAREVGEGRDEDATTKSGHPPERSLLGPSSSAKRWGEGGDVAQNTDSGHVP